MLRPGGGGMNELLEQLKALADATRLKIFKLVERQELCVCNIVPAVGLSQPTVSVHLGKLKRAGLVKERRSGQWSYYSADKEGLTRLREGLSDFLEAELEDIPEMRDLLRRLPAVCRGPARSCGPEASDNQLQSKQGE
ncbi:MAG: transcriptional regulator [Bacillota bacterium]|nr:MAG: transcriptional regulator [Bacillota bacterium]